MTFYKPNQKYNTTLSSDYTVGDTTLGVTVVVSNVPTIVTVARGTAKETRFTVTGTGVGQLTGAARLDGANDNIPAGSSVECMNDIDFVEQLASAVYDQSGLKGLVYAADGGSTDAYSITLPVAPSSYADLTGIPIAFKANTANTGGCTLAINGMAGGPKNIKNLAGSDPSDNAILSGAIILVVYDGTNFVLVGNGYISGDFNLIGTTPNVRVGGVDPSRTIVIPSGAMSPTTTAGCAAVATVEAGTNDVDYKVLDFDTTTVESAWTLFQMPNSWDGGTITFIPIWTAASGSGTVCFGLKGRAFADDDAIDQAYGTEQTSTDTLITAGDVHIGPESAAITLAGTPAGGQMVQLKITRQTGSDTLGVDARLIGIRILYKVAQYSD